MNLADINLIYIASIITALTVIGNFIWKIFKRMDDLMDKWESYENKINSLEIHMLRMSLLNDSLPVEERIKAGDQYLALGGNGYGRRIYEGLLEEVGAHNERVN